MNKMTGFTFVSDIGTTFDFVLMTKENVNAKSELT